MHDVRFVDKHYRQGNVQNVDHIIVFLFYDIL